LKPFFVYLLRCADGSFYVGHTDDLAQRVAQHQAGEVAGYTHERRPVELAWSQETATREDALSAERRIKGWGRAKKEALVRGDWTAIQRHAWGTRNALPEHLEHARASIPQPERRVRQAGPSIPQDERGVGQPGPSAPEPPPVRPEVSKGERPTGTPSDDSSLTISRLLQGERRAIAKAITLLESTRPDHRQQADALLNTLLPHTGRAMRLGISGVPGVGKSTFIEALGLALIDKGHKVAVLAIDPSSSISGGSILGDKTRMEKLSVHERAYIRPSPASGTLGGVADKTREAMLVCEAAGYDVVIVETVGVGQSETAVAGMTDMFVLMQLPNAGDDLQAIKKGVMELADLVVINKADLDPDAATRAQAQITSALRIFSFHGNPAHGAQRWAPQVVQISALAGRGVEAFWEQVERFHTLQRANGEFDARRQSQALSWLWDIIQSRLQSDFRAHPQVRGALPQTLADVRAAKVAPSAAARSLLDLFEQSLSTNN